MHCATNYVATFAGGLLAGLVLIVLGGAFFLRWLDGISAAQLYEDAYPERAEPAE